MNQNKKFIIKNQYFETRGQFQKKDIVMKRYDSYSITTEDFLDTALEPDNTCPYINETQYKIDKQVEALQKVIDFDSLSLNRIEECEHCKNQENVSEMIKELEDSKKRASDFKEMLNKAHYYLEKLRTDCENLREHGQNIKHFLWSLLDSDFTDIKVIESAKNKLIELEESKPEVTFFESDYESMFPDERLYDVDFSSLTMCQNPECLYQQKHIEIFQNFHEIIPDFIFDYVLVDEAINNFKKIDSWVDSVSTNIKKLLTDYPEIIEEWKNSVDFKEYIENYQKEFDDSYARRWKNESDFIVRHNIENDRLKKIFHNAISFLNEEGEHFEVIVIKDFYNNIIRVIEGLVEIDKDPNTSLQDHQEFTRKSYSELAPKLMLITELSMKEGKSDKAKEYKNKLLEIISAARLLAILNGRSVGQKFNLEID